MPTWMGWKREGRERAGHETRKSGVRETRSPESPEPSRHIYQVCGDELSSPQRLLTFTISWAKTPPTTAHTGAISEKQNLEGKTSEMNTEEQKGVGHVEGPAKGCLNETSAKESIPTAMLMLASRREG